MNHQDWKPVIIHGKAAPVNQRPPPKHYERTKEQKLEDEELGTHKKVPLSMAKMIQQGRIAKGFKTQKDLAIAVGCECEYHRCVRVGSSHSRPWCPPKIEEGTGGKVKVSLCTIQRCNIHLRTQVPPISLLQIWLVAQCCSRRVNPS
jgi:hypothetical protein